MDGLDSTRTSRDSTATQERKEPKYNELLMTLNDLIRKANRMAMQLSSGDIELYDEAYVLISDIQFEYTEDEGESFIQVTRR